MDAEAKVKITAEIDGLKKGLNEAAAAVRTATSSMGSAMDGVQGAFMKFNAALVAITMVLQGGKMFKDAIMEAKEMTGETIKLARVLGESAGDASDFRTAINDAYITVDEFTGANAKLTMKLKENEQNLQDMGVATRGTNGELLNQRKIFLNAVDALKQYKDGTDRNAAAMELFGRSGQEALKFLKINAELLEDAKKKNEELNLTITGKNIKAYAEYRAAMNDFDDAMASISKVISEAVMPRLTEMAQWFSEIAPEAIKKTRAAMAAFYATLDTFKLGVSVIVKSIETLVFALNVLAEVAYSAFWMDWDGVQEKWNNGMENLRNLIKRNGAELAEEAAMMKMQFAYNMDKGQKDDKKPSGSGGKGFVANKDAEKEGKSMIKAFDDELATRKQAQGAFNEYTKAQELAFWQEKLGIVGAMGVKFKDQYHEIHKKVAELDLEAKKESLNKQIETLKFEADLDKDALKKKADLYQEIFTKVATVYKTDSKEYRQALMDKLSADKEYLQKTIQIEMDLAQRKEDLRLNAFEMEQNDIDAYTEMGLMSEEAKLQRYKEMEEQRYQIRLETLQKEQELNAGDVEKQREINRKLEDLERQHGLKMKTISNQMSVQAFAPFKSMANSLETSLSGALSKMMQGTLKFSSFIKGILPAIGGAFANMVTQMAAKWIMEHIVMEGISKLFGATTAATTATMEATASATTIASKKATAAMVIPADAAMAAGAAAASVAAIPFVGWAMAPEVYAGTMGMVMSGLAVASASGGFDIPAGVNPVTQLHAEEMVLPAHLANPLRDTLAGGGTGGGTNITIQAIDAKGVKRLFEQHGSSLVSALKGQSRKFATS